MVYYSHLIFSIDLLYLCNSFIVFGQHAFPVHIQIQVGENSVGHALQEESKHEAITQPYSVSQRDLPVLPLTVSIPGQIVDI